MNSEKAIAVLNTLIEINNDRIECYQTASNKTKDKKLSTLFSEFVKTSKRFISELVTEVRKMGGSPTIVNKPNDKLLSVWRHVNVKSQTEDRKAIIRWFEEAEKAVREFYQNELRKNLQEINSDQHAMLSEQNYIIKDDYDKIKSMQDGME